jgi:hypothetical protein
MKTQVKTMMMIVMETPRESIRWLMTLIHIMLRRRNIRLRKIERLTKRTRERRLSLSSKDSREMKSKLKGS